MLRVWRVDLPQSFLGKMWGCWGDVELMALGCGGPSTSSDFSSCRVSSNPRAAAAWPPRPQLLGTRGSCCQTAAWRLRRGRGRPGDSHHHLRRLIPQGRCPPRPLGRLPLRPRSECVCLALSRQAWQGWLWRFKPDVESSPRSCPGC